MLILKLILCNISTGQKFNAHTIFKVMIDESYWSIILKTLKYPSYMEPSPLPLSRFYGTLFLCPYK